MEIYDGTIPTVEQFTSLTDDFTAFYSKLVEVAHQSATEINNKWNRKLKALGTNNTLVDKQRRELAMTLENLDYSSM